MPSTPILWTTNDLPMDRIVAILGADHVASLDEIACRGRAAGAWAACEREHYAAYRSLSRILRGPIPANTNGAAS